MVELKYSGLFLPIPSQIVDTVSVAGIWIMFGTVPLKDALMPAFVATIYVLYPERVKKR